MKKAIVGVLACALAVTLRRMRLDGRHRGARGLSWESSTIVRVQGPGLTAGEFVPRLHALDDLAG